MKNGVKLCLAFFLALTVLVQYSFSPEALVAYGLNNTGEASQTEEVVTDDDQTTEGKKTTEQDSTKLSSEDGAKATESVKSTDPTEANEGTKPAEENQKGSDEQDVKYPAKTFSETAGGVAVSISAPEGALPEGTTMKVAAVKASTVQGAVEGLMEDSEAVKAVDVTFYNNEGKEIEPKKNISVTFTCNAFAGLKEASVIHIKDSGVAEIVENGKVTGNKASFKSDEFSIYVITDDSGEDVTFRKTFHFEDINSTGTYEPYEFTNKAGKSVTQQMAKTGDGLEPVGNPYHVGYDFDGWYIWDNGSWGDKVVFDNPSFVGTVSQNEDITVRAKYGNVVYLNFHENPEDASEDIILTTMAVPKDSSVAVNDVKAPLPGAGTAFRGWALKGTTEAVDNPYTATANADLYPVFSGAHWLRFAGNGTGASYTDAICVFDDQDLSEVTKPSDPTRPGYNFAGWYNAKDGESQFVWSGTLREDKTVYAHWTPKNNVTYNVFYWAENADDDNYSFITSKKLNGTAGAQTEAAELTDQEKASISSVDWKGFNAQEITQTEIEGDGSTIVNVFYDRKIITLTFHNDNSEPRYIQDAEGDYYRVTTGNNNNTYYYLTSAGTYERLNTNQYYVYRTEGPLAAVDGDDFDLYTRDWEWSWSEWDFVEVYSKANVRKTLRRYRLEGGNVITIHAKYGSDIHDQWPNNPGGGTDWYLSPQGNVFLVTLNTTPAEDTHYYYRPHNGRYTFHTRYMIQAIGGGNNFSVYTTASVRSNNDLSTTADDYSPIKGFRLNAASNSDASTIRNTNGGDPGAVSEGSYSRSAAIGASYGNAHNNTLTFYYLRNQYDINFISNGETVKTESGIYYEENIADKVPSEYVVDETEATIGGVPMVFKGWFDNKACEGQAYTFDKMPAGNLTLYAKWAPVWFVVNVNPDGGALNGNSPSGGDSTCFWKEYGTTINEYVTTRDYYEVGEEYAGQKYYYHFVQDINVSVDQRKAYYTTDASLSTDGKVYAKEDGAYVFLGWYVGDKPYDFSTEITGPLTITAKWRRTGTFHVAYQGVVDGIGSYVPSPEEGYADGAKITVAEAPKDINPMYVFDGWEVVDADGKTLDNNDGAYYQPGDELTLESKNADSSKVIHVQAHYTKVDDSTIPVTVVPLVFDANGGTLSEAPSVTDKNNNTYSATINSSNTTATYNKLPLNQDYDLSTISSKVTRTDEYELLGWNTSKDAADNEEVLYKTNVVIGVDDLEDKSNTLYAVWGKTYTITWKSQDGNTTYETDTKVKKNSQPSFDGTEPTKEADEQYTYTFAGWATSANQESGKPVSELPKVKADATYYAAFSKTVNKYKIEFVNDDGTGLQSEELEYGTMPEYKGDTPKKEPSGGYSYEFVGWTPKIVQVTGDATYTATFKKVKSSAEITYDLNGGEYNGSTADIIETHNIGEEITVHEAPTREGYVFQYWMGSEYQPGDKYTVLEDHTFTAIWKTAGTDDNDDSADKDKDKDKASSETKTGDNTNLLGLLAAMTAAVLGLFALVVVKRREEDEE